MRLISVISFLEVEDQKIKGCFLRRPNSNTSQVAHDLYSRNMFRVRSLSMFPHCKDFPIYIDSTEHTDRSPWLFCATDASYCHIKTQQNFYTVWSKGTLCKGNMALCIFHIISIHLMFQLFWCGKWEQFKVTKKKKNQILMTVLLQILMTAELISTVQFLSSAGAVTGDKQEDF